MFVSLNLKRNVGDRKWIESEGLAQQNDLVGEFSKRIIPRPHLLRKRNTSGRFDKSLKRKSDGNKSF